MKNNEWDTRGLPTETNFEIKKAKTKFSKADVNAMTNGLNGRVCLRISWKKIARKHHLYNRYVYA